MKYAFTVAILMVTVASLGWTLTSRSSADGLCEACDVALEGQPVAWTVPEATGDM